MNDQATQLREMMEQHASPKRATHDVISCSPRTARLNQPPATQSLATAVAVTSGKGGVGKSNIAVGLAAALATLGRKVCLLDADLGLANADVLCNLAPRRTLEHVLAGQCRLAESALLAPGGFRLIPGASGVARLADLGPRQRDTLLRQLEAIDRVADVVVIDTGAGIGANVLDFAAAAHSVLVVTTPEPTAMTDGYGALKALAARAPSCRPGLIVNMARDLDEAAEVHRRVDMVSRRFLQREVPLAAAVPLDPQVVESVRMRLPFVVGAPECSASKAVAELAARLAGIEPPQSARRGFFARLTRRIRGRDR